MPRIVRIHEAGEADVLRFEELPDSEPDKGEVRLKVEAIGINRAEVLFRQGMYLDTPKFPARLGYEAAGVVEAVGPGTSDIQIGDRVSSIPAFPMGKYGVYGESAIVPARAVARYRTENFWHLRLPKQTERYVPKFLAALYLLRDPDKYGITIPVVEPIEFDEVRITGIRTDVDDLCRLLVAASAVIPIFGFPDWEYARLGEVLIYPSAFGNGYRTDDEADRPPR